MRPAALVALLVCAGCSTVSITPATILAAEAVPRRERVRVATRLGVAVQLANAFLASRDCKTLPGGRYVLRFDELTYVTRTGERYPVHIRFTLIGDLAVTFGAVAQERSDGFVVGRGRRSPRHVAVDNSLFYDDGQPRTIEAIAGVLLHETAHQVHRLGTVGVWNTIAYYAEVAWTWRTHNDHSAEEVPLRINRELTRYLRRVQRRRLSASAPPAAGRAASPRPPSTARSSAARRRPGRRRSAHPASR